MRRALRIQTQSSDLALAATIVLVVAFLQAAQAQGLHEESLRIPMAGAGARGLEDIALGGYSTVNVQHLDSGLGRDVFEPRRGRMRGAWRVRYGYLLSCFLGDDGSREKSGVNAN